MADLRNGLQVLRQRAQLVFRQLRYCEWPDAARSQPKGRNGRAKHHSTLEPLKDGIRSQSVLIENLGQTGFGAGSIGAMKAKSTSVGARWEERNCGEGDAENTPVTNKY